MALNDTSSLALLASFPDLPDQKREEVEAGLSAEGRKIAVEIQRLHKNDGFILQGASSPRQVAELYLNWAKGATAQTPVRRRAKAKARRTVQPK
jgi:hypothetical protein